MPDIRHHADTRQTDRRDWDNLLSQQFTLKCKYISTRLRETDTGSQRQPGFTQSLGDKYAQIQPIYREDTEKCVTSSLPKCKSEMELAYFSPCRDYERASKLVDQSSSGSYFHGPSYQGCTSAWEPIELRKTVDYDIYCPLDNSFIIFASIYSCHLSNILSNIQLARRQTPVREGQAGERCMYGSLNWLYRIICDRVFAHRRSVETPDFLTGNS